MLYTFTFLFFIAFKFEIISVMEPVQKSHRELPKSFHWPSLKVNILYNHDQNEEISIGAILLTKLYTLILPDFFFSGVLFITEFKGPLV